MNKIQLPGGFSVVSSVPSGDYVLSDAEGNQIRTFARGTFVEVMEAWVDGYALGLFTGKGRGALFAVRCLRQSGDALPEEARGAMRGALVPRSTG